MDSRTGSGGRVGTEYAKRLLSDGSALHCTPAFPMVLFPPIYPTLQYNTLHDFAPVASTMRSMYALSARPMVPASVRCFADFVAWCRTNRDEATFGAPQGASQHFAGVMLSRAAHIDLTLVSYRGGKLSITDVLGGHIVAVVSHWPRFCRPPRVATSGFSSPRGHAGRATRPTCPRPRISATAT